MPAKHVVRLSDDQRDRLDALTRTGTRHVRTVQHARTLLLTDAADDGPAWTDDKVADALGCGIATVARTRRRFCEDGLDEASVSEKAGRGVRSRSTVPPRLT